MRRTFDDFADSIDIGIHHDHMRFQASNLFDQRIATFGVDAT
jgi:hypothetical protein